MGSDGHACEAGVDNPAGSFTWLTTDVDRHRPWSLGGHDGEACRLDRDKDM